MAVTCYTLVPWTRRRTEHWQALSGGSMQRGHQMPPADLKSQRRRKLLQTASFLLGGLLLLCAIHFGWLERFGLAADSAALTASSAAPHAAAGGGGGGAVRLEAHSRGIFDSSGLGESSARRCEGPFDVPKVALMFLVRGPIHHERTWAAWLAGAGGLVPTAAAAEACCGRSRRRQPRQLRERRGGGGGGVAGSASSSTAHFPSSRRRRSRRLQDSGSGGGSGVLQAQRLFSVYVHKAPGLMPYPEGHVFHGRDLERRVKVEWGRHSVTQAMRLLLAAAVADPANQRFQFLDETTLPLYPPHLLWAQFMGENRTRMSACDTQVSNLRWVPPLESAYLKQHMWRKSSQWSMIQRQHAELMVADTAVWEAITPTCLALQWVDPATNTSTPYPCVSDEHYLPTVLAAAGASNETTCAGNAMHVEWPRVPSKSPRTYWQQDANLDTFDAVRGQLGLCDFAAAISDANLPGNFENATSLASFRCPPGPPLQYRAPYADRIAAMGRCSLLSRKWAPSTAGLMFAALTNASRPSEVLHLRHAEPDPSPPAETRRRWWQRINAV